MGNGKWERAHRTHAGVPFRFSDFPIFRFPGSPVPRGSGPLRLRWIPEIHARRIAVRRVRDLVILPLLRARYLRREDRREGADQRVVLLHGAVVVRARDGDAILRARELVLQAEEALVTLELRIRLGDGEEPPEGAGHRGVRRRHLLGVLALHRAEQATASARHLAEHGKLLLRETLHRLHEVGNQVRTTLELDLDLPLRRVGLLVERLDLVVPAAREGDREKEREPPTCHGYRS